MPLTAAEYPAADRGALHIADRVLARIAAQAANEALAEHAPEPDRLAYPRASAARGRRGRGVRLRLGLDLPYPVDIAEATGAVHRRVVHRLAQLAGAEEPSVALVVERLVRPEPPELQ
ncbi:hypothetical protein GXW83_25235 [Streptacidiphilus sp. PB12-B1b]|nr:hypothetical protein GXW83_25235 [Streptacidiphilus sp. PB12-B1b]